MRMTTAIGNPLKKKNTLATRKITEFDSQRKKNHK